MASDLLTFIKKRDAQLREIMKEELEAAIIDGKTYHQNAVRTWVNKPKWVVRSEHTATELRATLEVTGDSRQIWLWVDEGTGLYGPNSKRYPITPRRPGGKLVFRGGYDPKTRAVAKANVGSGTSSGDLAFMDIVWHPGIKPREFSKTYRERILYPTLKDRIVKRVRRS